MELLARYFKTLVVALLICTTFVFLLELGIQFYPPLFPLVLNLIGKDPICTPVGAFDGGAVHCSVIDGAAPELFGLSSLKNEDGLQFVQTNQGNWWVPEGDEQFLPDLLSQQENRIYGDGDRGVRPGDVVLDCGAHIGLFTRMALVQGAALVVAVEISPRNIECLRRNFADEIESGRVIVYPKGVWHEDDYLTLYAGEKNSAGDSVVITDNRSAKTRKVPLTTIDKLVDELELDEVDFIKMDIKGAAANALKGASQTLAQHSPRLAIATEEGSDHPDLIARTVKSFHLGYRTICGACTARPGTFTWRDLVSGLDNYRVYPLVLFFEPVRRKS